MFLLPFFFFFSATGAAANLESRIFCGALLSAVLTRAPVPSMLDDETRKAIYELSGFGRDEKLPQAVPSKSEDLLVTDVEASDHQRALVADRIRSVLEAYFQSEDTRVIGTVIHGHAQGTKFMNVVHDLEEPLLQEFAPQIREQDFKLWGSSGDERQSERQSQIWRFFSRVNPAAGRWLYASQSHLVRASTIRTILDVRRLDDAVVRRELTNEAIVSNDGYLDRLLRMSASARQGEPLERHWKHLYGQAEVQIDRLYRFDAKGEGTTVVLMQIRKLPERNFMSSDRGRATVRARPAFAVPAMGLVTP